MAVAVPARGSLNESSNRCVLVSNGVYNVKSTTYLRR
jgi:hypothetical protein